MTSATRAPERLDEVADRSFERTPGGYVLRYPAIGITIEGRYIRWEHGALYAVVSVRAGTIAGVRTVRGVVAEVRVNLSSDRGRSEIAKACVDRAPGVDLDWRGFMEEFAISVMAAEREGTPFELVGQLPKRVDPGYALAPLFPAGRPAFVYGPPAATKGFLMTAACLSIETGVTIMPGLVPRRGGALYLDWESDRWDLDDRVRRIAKGAGIPGSPTIRYRECVGPLVDQVEDVVREVTRTGTTFLVVDSVGMAQSSAREGGDANEGTIRMFQAVRPLLARGVTVVFVDHVTGAELGSKHRSTKPYGSVFKLALARNTYEIRPLPSASGEEGVRHVVIKHRKANTSDYLPDMGFALRFGEGSVSWEAEEVRAPAEDEEAGSVYPTSTRQLIRDLLERGHLSEDELADETGRKVDTVGRVLRRYGPSAKKDEDRWFNRLPSGKWENLPLGPMEVTDAG